MSKFFALLLPVSLIAFSNVINNKPGPFLSFLFVCFFSFRSLYRNQRDFQESLPLNVLNVGARLEFASGNGTGIERFHREPLVQQEGVYTELLPESMMVIILITKLKLTNMSLIKKGNKGCAILPFFYFLAVPLCSLHVPLSLHLYCYTDAPWLWSFNIKLSILNKFDCFIHLPLLFIQFYSSVYVLIFLYIYLKHHLFD